MPNHVISQISKNYAKALVEIAQENNSFDYIKDELYSVIEVLNTSEDLSIVMNNSSVSSSSKIDIIDSVFNGKIDLKILNFLKILVEKNRFWNISAIYNAYVGMLDLYSNKKHVKIVSSVPLDDYYKEKIVNAVQAKISCEVIPNWEVDESIIAGLVFKYDDCVVDTSVRAKLENLSRNILR